MRILQKRMKVVKAAIGRDFLASDGYTVQVASSRKVVGGNISISQCVVGHMLPISNKQNRVHVTHDTER